jgi:pimeloyl-ACP methyl ester carboxylesterase
MSIFVLVHGGFHGGWSWELVGPRLEAEGHTVLTPDLPGHGSDTTPQQDIAYAMAVERIRSLVESAAEPVILVGHSMSGLIITHVAEAVPERVIRMVWVGAFLVPSGYSLKAYLEDYRHLGESQVLPNAIPSADLSHVVFNPEKAREVFYHTTPEDLATRATARLRPVAMPYLTTPVHWTEARFGCVPRTYVVCLQDRCIPLAIQRKMIEDLPCASVFELDTDHSPFECAPSELAAIMLSLA